ADERQRVAKAIFAREQSRSTGMEHGVALPHGAVDGLEDIAAALGVTRGGLDFGAIDKKPTHLIVLLAIPQTMRQVHVRTLAGSARLLNEEELRDKLVGAKSAAEAFAAIRAGEAET